MDNSTYDALNLSPNNNETYSTLATVTTKVNQSCEAQRQANVKKREIKEVNKQDGSKSAPHKTKLIVVLIIMMVILLLTTIVSITLSIATYSRLNSEQSKAPNQLDNINNDIISVLHSFSTSIQSQLTNTLIQPLEIQEPMSCQRPFSYNAYSCDAVFAWTTLTLV